MACESCDRRELDCDGSRPRCSRCKQSHLRCTYGPHQLNFEFRDETERARASSIRAKRRKTSSIDQVTDETNIMESSGSLDNSMNFQDLSGFDEAWAGMLCQDLLDSALWQDEPLPDFDISNVEIHQELVYSEPFPPKLPDRNTGALQTPETPLVIGESTCQVSEPQHTTCLTEVNSESLPLNDGKSYTISEHVLGQHYARNLTARYSSRHPGWNFYMHFYNRFMAAHPLVLSSIYAWTSAHLFYSNALESLDTAFSYYQKCLDQIYLQYEIQTPQTWDCEYENHVAATISKLSRECLDAVIVAFYFLGSFDLIVSRAEELRKILRVVSLIIRTRGCTNDVGGIFLRVSTWFCFLDARESAFGQGTCLVLEAIGGEEGLVQAMYSSRDFLRREYSILYPVEELKREEVHAPLLALILRLVATFSDISKNYLGTNETIRDGIRERLNSYGQTIIATGESFALERNVASTYNVLLALYHAVEIYYSRVFSHRLALYTSDYHAVKIIKVTERMYKSFDLAESDPPRTKSWPIPLVMAAIEASDSIYRNWALRKLEDTRQAGDLYKNSCLFVKRVQRAEEKAGFRVPLGDIMANMDKGFVI